LSTARHLQLLGRSGCGKSHLAKHTVLSLPESAWLPIFIDASMYEGRLSALINRRVARFLAKSGRRSRQGSQYHRPGRPPCH